MRLLMVGPWRLPAMRRHIDWAVASDIEVCVADFRTPPEVIRPSNFRVSDLLPRRVRTIHQNRARKKSQRALNSAVLRLQYVAAEFRPHMVHSYMLQEHTDICIRSRLQPLVVSAWGSLNHLLTSEATTQNRRWIRLLRGSADTLLVESPNFLRALEEYSHAPLHLECSPVGVDSGLFNPGYREEAAAWRFVLNIPSDAIVLLSPRGWSPTYGQQHIMQAFAHASHQLDKPLVLVLRGLGRMRQPERLAHEVHELGVSLGVGHAIRWIPAISFEDLPGVYALADVVINYPRRDAFPSTLLEAAACARPVITSDLPAYRNTFVERFCRLVEPENPAALAEALIELVASDPAIWAARAQQARQAVLADYDESIQKERLMAVYHRIAFENTRRLRVVNRHGYS